MTMSYKCRCVIMFVLLMCLTLGLWAVPARRVAITVGQPDGTELTLVMCGDEHFHSLVTADGVPVVRYDGAYYYAIVGEEGIVPSALLAHEECLRSPEEKAFVKTLLDVPSARAARMHRRGIGVRSAEEHTSEVPTEGEVCVPVLLVQYTDVKFSSSDPKGSFEERLNGEHYTDEGGYGSIRQYFMDQSEGKFRPKFDAIGPVTLSHEMKYYGGNDKEGVDLRPREMVSEACRRAYSELNTDFARYDNNGDGYVDIVYVIYAGYGEASYPDKLENTVWPHQWQLETPLTLGGVKIGRYACNNELDGYSGNRLDGIGTFCHEFSHCLGLPDFYDTAGGDGFGMSVWSVMDYGCYNNDGHTPCGYTAYEKSFLGWTSLVELTNPTHVTLRSLSDGGKAYKIVNEVNPDEFYVVEYCKKAGWNAYAPADGMLVLHVDYLSTAWHENVVNNDPEHPRVSLIPADGELTSRTLLGDVWPGPSGNTQLTSTSSPPAKVYTGGYMNKDITNISQNDDGVTFSFMQESLPAPLLHEPDSVCPSGFTVTWSTVDGVVEYEVGLDLIGEEPETDKGIAVVPIHTVRVEGNNYTFKELDGGHYRCRVRSVKDGVVSHYSNAVAVSIDDSLLPQTGVSPYIYIHQDSLYMEAPDSVAVYYTTDGSHPSVYSARYAAPLFLGDKMHVRAIARRQGCRSSEIVEQANWFALDGATYRVLSTIEPAVMLSEAMGGNSHEDYAGHYVFGDEVLADTVTYVLKGIDPSAFRGASALRSVVLEGDSLCSVGDSLFYGCRGLNAVVWGVDMPIPETLFDEDSYHNLLLYLPDSAYIVNPLLEAKRMTVVKNGKSGVLCLNVDKPFYCPRSFVAERVTYSRSFGQVTGMGSSAGWETIVLPFDVEHITHSTKGEITPFGVEGTAHCWLATPQDGAFAGATEILANQPYLIAFPHNDVYGELSLAGSITFSADDATIYPAHSEARRVARGWAALRGDEQWDTVSLALVPTYDPVEASDGVYALNVGAKYGSYMPGSVFVAGRYATRPFSVYMEPLEDDQPAPFYRIAVPSTGESAEDNPDSRQGLSIIVRDGSLHLVSPKECTVRLYDAVGRLVLNVACKEGTTEVGPLEEGMYIIERTKIYVGR